MPTRDEVLKRRMRRPLRGRALAEWAIRRAKNPRGTWDPQDMPRRCPKCGCVE